MLNEDYYKNSLLSPEDARLFLLANSLTPLLANTHFGRLLSMIGVRPLRQRWDYDALAEARQAFEYKDALFFKSGLMRYEVVHDFAIEAIKDERLVQAVRSLLQKVSNKIIVNSWAYLSIYVPVENEEIKELFKKDQHFFLDLFSKYLSLGTLTKEWVNSNPYRPYIQLWGICEAIYNNDVWTSIEVILDSSEEYYTEHANQKRNDVDRSILYFSSILRILQGKPFKKELVDSLENQIPTLLNGFELFMHGQREDAYNTLLPIAKHWAEHFQFLKTNFIPDFIGVIFYLCRLFLKKDLDQYTKDLHTIYSSFKRNDEENGYRALESLYIQKYNSEVARYIDKNVFAVSILHTGTSIFSKILAFYASVVREDQINPQSIISIIEKYKKSFPIIAHLFNDALVDLDMDVHDIPDVSFPRWIELVKPAPLWEKQLDKLASALSINAEKEEKKVRRLVWLVDPDDYEVTPMVQILSSKGTWSAGQKFSQKRLSTEVAPYITPQDRQMAIAYSENRSYYGTVITFDELKGFTTLVGHPYLFHYKTREKITLELQPISVCVTEKNNLCNISLSVKPHYPYPISLQEIRPNVWGLYVFDEKTLAINSILGEKGIDLPTEHLNRFLNVMQADQEVSINMKTSTPHKEGDATPVIQLWYRNNVFQAALRVRPSETPNSTAYPPGTGSEEILQMSDNVPAIYDRDFDKERQAAQALIDACPALGNQLDPNWDWFSPEISDFFQLITELRETDIPCKVEWPEGEKFRLAGLINRQQISIRTSKSSQGDWFSLSGEVHINEDQVIQLTELLERSSGLSSRFVQLKNGEFIALTNEVQRSLEKLRLYSSRKKGNERQVHPLAGPLVQDVLEDMKQESDTSWNDMIKKMHKAFELKPEVPATLQADLRPYQLSGFVWLCRLAEWGVGGCLADDMGLGKTIQSIAVMLREVRKGPCLIIAPTSVCPNWEEEIHRFAPSLQVIRLRDAPDRKKIVDQMQSGMVLIVGYGLLARVQEILSSHQWQMVVFDEAQALKNSATKRSRAAGSIPSRFSLALTGTPIENRLEDLWSVFDIINPGLLGTLNDFHRRFMGAEEGGAAAQALKMLIRPFILRRLKSQVLDDLPELTEQTIIIEPTEKEAAFYESLRRRALEHLDNSGEQTKGQKRFNILSELTRLRRACCHAILADPNVGTLVEPVSSKLLRFLELLDEARSGGHRLLVFSQFTGHLALVRKELDERQISYQYLDGQTPEEKRRESVAAFQRGEGDLFLISLKAGGQGLNLTAADYVVHLDPWWNPAVEDQATDRAHRIGQKKPVTVYRLVMAHSVEEKILKLHAQKRDLAADFLEGHEEAVTQATLSEEELLALLQ